MEPFRHWVSELGVSGLRLDDRIGALPLASLRILDIARTTLDRKLASYGLDTTGA